MSYQVSDYASAVWAYSTRTLVSGTPGTPSTPAEAWAATIWTYTPRTLTTVVPPTFDQALAAFLMTDAQIQADYPPCDFSEYPASVSNGAADRDAPLPLLVFVVTEEKPIVVNGRPLQVIGAGARRITHVTVQFHVVATGADTATLLGSRLKARLLPSSDGSYTPPPLVFADGRDCGRFAPGPESTVLDTERSFDNRDIFVHVVPITWIIARG